MGLRYHSTDCYGLYYDEEVSLEHGILILLYNIRVDC